jgi:hypothetical protein
MYKAVIVTQMLNATNSGSLNSRKCALTSSGVALGGNGGMLRASSPQRPKTAARKTGPVHAKIFHVL